MTDLVNHFDKLGKDLIEARLNAYRATEAIDYVNKYMRHDIGRSIEEANI